MVTIRGDNVTTDDRQIDGENVKWRGASGRTFDEKSGRCKVESL